MTQPHENEAKPGASQRCAASAPTMLKALLREHRLYNYRTFKRAYREAAAGIDHDLVETYPGASTYHKWISGRLKDQPHSEHCVVLEAMFPGYSAQQLFAPPPGSASPAPGAAGAATVRDAATPTAEGTPGEGFTLPTDADSTPSLDGDRPQHEPTVLKMLLKARHWQKWQTFARQWDKVAKTIDPHLVGTCPSHAQFYRWLRGELLTTPYPDACMILEAMFPGWTVEQLFQPASTWQEGSPATTVVKPGNSAAVPPEDTTQATPAPQPLPHADQPAAPPAEPEAAADGTAPADQEHGPDSAGELAPAAFPGSVAEEASTDGDAEVREQLANLLREWVGRMNRRELLQLFGGVTAIISAASPMVTGLDIDEMERLGRAVVSPSRVDAKVIDLIEAMFRICKREEDMLGPRRVLDTAVAQQNQVHSLLGECPDALRPRLLSVYSDMSTSIGYYFFDLGNVESAMHHWDEARSSAQDAKNIELSIYALGNMCYAAAWQGKNHTAIDLAAAAQSLANKTGDPLMRVCAATEAARAYAIDGQYSACLIEFENAANNLLSTTGGAFEESPAYWYHEGWLISQKSECLLRLGKPQEAVASGRAALALYDNTIVSGLVACELRLGNACLQSDEIDEAAYLLSDAASLVAKIRSARWIKELRRTRARMQPWQDTRAVKELDEHLMNYGLAPNRSA